MFKGAIYTIVDLLTRCVRALARFRQGPALPERKQDAAGDKAERDAKARPGWERAAREDKIGDEDLGPDETRTSASAWLRWWKRWIIADSAK
ncbi:hypothetical protein GCM10020258_51830 [Sphingomonas yabuuchiae]